MLTKLKQSVPAAVTFLTAIGVDMTGLTIPWLGYSLIALAVALSIIPLWAPLKKFASIIHKQPEPFRLPERLVFKTIEQYAHGDGSGRRTFTIGIENTSPSETARGVRVRMTRLDPMPTPLAGALPLPMQFRDDATGREPQRDIRPESIEVVNLITWDTIETEEQFFPNFQIEHTAAVSQHILGAAHFERWRTGGPQNAAREYEFDLEITVDGLAGKVSTTFRLTVNWEAQRIELARVDTQRP